MSKGVTPMRSLVVWPIRAYQKLISPGLPRCCKYYPSCSQYAIDAVTEFGILRGSLLAAWRLLRCNPLSYGGYDPVQRQKLFAPRPAPNREDHTGQTCAGDGPGVTPDHAQRVDARPTPPVGAAGVISSGRV